MKLNRRLIKAAITTIIIFALVLGCITAYFKKSTDYTAVTDDRSDNMGNSTQKRYRKIPLIFKGEKIYISLDEEHTKKVQEALKAYSIHRNITFIENKNWSRKYYKDNDNNTYNF